jgi:hypothetical protein
MIGMKKTPNAQRRTSNVQLKSAAGFDVRRSAFGVQRFLFFA